MGLDLFILPRVGFYFGRGLVTFMCPFKVDPGTEAKIPPVVWDSAGFSTNYMFETQVLPDLNGRTLTRVVDTVPLGSAGRGRHS